jgi:hypothetical protein
VGHDPDVSRLFERYLTCHCSIRFSLPRNNTESATALPPIDSD